MSEPTNGESKPRLRSAANSKLPIASVIPDTDQFREAIRLVERATAIKVEMDELKEELDGLIEQMAAICEVFHLEHGFKYGLFMFEYHGWKTRDTLSKEKLLELGVPADTIAKAYTTSKPYLSTKIDPFDIP